MTEKAPLSFDAKIVEKVKAWINGKTKMIDMLDVAKAFEYLEGETTGQMGSPVCSCKDWDENIKKVDEPRMLLHARNPGTANYNGKQFVYCPWCSHPVRS